MKVKQLEIDSFRGIKNLTLDFDLEEPTVFLGVNGSGKSSILDCLAILLSWFNAGVQNVHKQGNHFNDSDINNQSKVTRNKIKIYTNELEDISWDLYKIRDNWRYQEKLVFDGVYELVDRAYKKAEHSSYLPIAIYYHARRFVSDIPLETKDNLFNDFNAYNLALDDKNLSTGQKL